MDTIWGCMAVGAVMGLAYGLIRYGRIRRLLKRRDKLRDDLAAEQWKNVGKQGGQNENN